jgi:hypothetical protein
MRFQTSLVAPIVIVGALAPQALAWNDYGHELSAYLAYRGLTPEAKAAVNALLKQHPQYDLLVAKCPEGFDKDLYVFMRAATWPDMLRSEANPLHATDHHGPWHYVDYTIDQDGVHGPAPVVEWKPGTDPENILQALQKCEADLTSKDVSAPDKAKMLCWYLHLTGDLHQPNHTTAIFSKKYPEGDRGGNLFIVSDAGRITRLHTFWDTILGDSRDPVSIVARGNELAALPELTREGLKDSLEHQAASDWAQEGHDLAKSVVYADGKLEGVVPPDEKQLPKEAPALPKEYRAAGTKVAQARISLVGYRLADKLNVLAASAAATSDPVAKPAAAPAVEPKVK